MIEYKNFPGEFIKPCPCSTETVECGYYNLNLHTGCPFGCSYCILQTYLEDRSPVYYKNIEDMKLELGEISKSVPNLRLGTGELSDSLAWDRETSYSDTLLDIFSEFPDIVFEFKTKSNVIENLIKRKSVPQNIVVSWSLNPRTIIESEEPSTARLKERLKALKIVQAKGYKIGIHFDPLIICENWQQLYLEFIKEIKNVIDPSRIAWWSIGALRFPLSLKEHILKHKDSGLFYGELIKGFDNKYRYFRPLRTELFKFISKSLGRLISSEIPIYLCMEDQEMWEEIIPAIKPEKQEINEYLYLSALGK